MRPLLPSIGLALLLGAAYASAQGPAPGTQDMPTGAPPVLDLPQIGDPADTALSPAEEAHLGASVVAQFYQYEYVLEDPEIADYLSSVGWRLAAASGTKPAHLEFFMVKDPRINAFALPGGFIGINAGLLLAASNESELAGVMGHELAHVTQRHIARSATETGGIATIATWAAVLAAILAGSGNSDVVLAALSMGQAATYQRQVNYTRAHELEADRIGIRTMVDAGFNAEGMSSFFQRLEQQSRLYGSGIPDILRTHPVNTVRIAEARSRAASLPKTNAPDSMEFGFMKARTEVFAADQPSSAVETFARRIEGGRDTPANRYGLAFAYHELGQYQRASETLAPVLKQYPRQANLNLLQAALDFRIKGSDAGLAAYDRMLALYPRHAPVILEYAAALIEADQAQHAREILLSHEQALGTSLETYRLLSQAARAVDNNAEASFQMANFLFLRGDAGGALSQLDAGLRIASLTPQDRARLTARRAEVREALPRNYDPEGERERQRQRRRSQQYSTLY
jgi:predicted Zn-dependent protease